MNWHRFKVALLMGLLLFVQTQACLAASRNLAGLRVGMSRSDVIGLLGAPLEKKEYEIKREESWHYLDVEVTFTEDAVLRWYLKVAEPKNPSIAEAPLPHEPEQPVASENLPATNRRASSDKKSEKRIEQKVLEDILRSLPSEDGPKA